MLATVMVVCFLVGGLTANAFGSTAFGAGVGAALFLGSFIPRADGVGILNVTPDLSALSTSFVKFGGTIFRNQVNDWNLGDGVTPYKNVKEPISMPKLSALGGPQPYSAADSVTGNGAKYTDRILTVYQSKWDFDVDPEVYRNTYLADQSDAPFYQVILDQVGKEYLSQILLNTVGNGTYSGAGTTPAAIATGWITNLKAQVTATTLTPISIGVTTSSNAVTQVETFLSGLPTWWRTREVVIKCSYAFFDLYKIHYRTINPFGFVRRENGKYYIDGWENAQLEPCAWIPASNNGVLAVTNKALVWGTDGDRISVAATPYRNIIKTRLLFPIGFEFADMGCVAVSDKFVV